MPLTKKGTKILKKMRKTYGKEKGEQVFYASANKGKIKGVHEGLTKEDIEKYGTEEEKEFLKEDILPVLPALAGAVVGGVNFYKMVKAKNKREEELEKIRKKNIRQKNKENKKKKVSKEDIEKYATEEEKEFLGDL